MLWLDEMARPQCAGPENDLGYAVFQTMFLAHGYTEYIARRRIDPAVDLLRHADFHYPKRQQPVREGSRIKKDDKTTRQRTQTLPQSHTQTHTYHSPTSQSSLQCMYETTGHCQVAWRTRLPQRYKGTQPRRTAAEMAAMVP